MIFVYFLKYYSISINISNKTIRKSNLIYIINTMWIFKNCEKTQFRPMMILQERYEENVIKEEGSSKNTAFTEFFDISLYNSLGTPSERLRYFVFRSEMKQKEDLLKINDKIMKYL